MKRIRMVAGRFFLVIALAVGLMPTAAFAAPAGELAAAVSESAGAAAEGEISVSAERLGIGGGGAVFDPAISPFNGDDMAVGTDMGDLYVTHDGGSSWSKKTVGRVWDIQYDPVREGVVYACGSGIWRSSDRGDTFELMWPKAAHVTGEPTKFEDTRSYYFNSDGYDPYSQVVSIAVDRAGDALYALAIADDYSTGAKRQMLVLYQGSFESGAFREIARRGYERCGLHRLYDNTKVLVHAGVPLVATQTGVYAYEGAVGDAEDAAFQGHLVALYEPDGESSYSVVDFDQSFDSAGEAVYWMAEGLEGGSETPVTSLRRVQIGTDGEGADEFTPSSWKLAFDDLTDKMNDSAYGLDRTRDGVEYGMRINEIAAATAERAYFYVYMVTPQKSDSILVRYDGADADDKPFRWVYGYELNDTVPNRFYLKDGVRWEWNYRMWGIATSPAEPNGFLLATHAGAYRSTDCEASLPAREGAHPRSANIAWCHSKLVPSDTVRADDGDWGTYVSTGIDNVTTYGIRQDPFDANHVALLNTDFSLTLSNDGGRTWSEYRVKQGIGNSWINTIYDLEFDRFMKGRAYGLWAGRSDTPYETRGARELTDWEGGLATLDATDGDWAALDMTWEPNEGALPANATPVALDVVYPEGASVGSPGGERTLWVATFNYGLFRSTDSGGSFKAVNGGLPASDGMIFAADVEASEDGSHVFALTARRTGPVEAGKVYALGEDRATWEEVPLPEGATCPRDVTWDETAQVLYISCCADNAWKSNGGDATQPDFYNWGGGLYQWKPGEAVAQAVDAGSDAVGRECSIEGAVVDDAGNLFASDARGNVFLRRAGQAGFERIYEKFHVASKGVQLVSQSVAADGTRTDTLALPSFGGGLLRMDVTFAAAPAPTPVLEPDPDPVKPIGIGGAKVTLSRSTYTYSGKEFKPTVASVTLGGKVLVVGTDYRVASYSGNTNAGTATVTVKGVGAYTGKATATFTIKPKAVTPSVSLSKTSYAYSGAVRKPAVTVKVGGKKVSASGYRVTYPTGRKNVGSYKVSVSLKGNYSGTKYATFKIAPKATALTKLASAKRGFIAKWKRQAAQVDGYQLQYSQKAGFKGAKTVTVKGAKAVSKKVLKLKPKVRYHVRVRTYKKVGKATFYSAWSKSKAVTTRKR